MFCVCPFSDFALPLCHLPLSPFFPFVDLLRALVFRVCPQLEWTVCHFMEFHWLASPSPCRQEAWRLKPQTSDLDSHLQRVLNIFLDHLRRVLGYFVFLFICFRKSTSCWLPTVSPPHPRFSPRLEISLPPVGGKIWKPMTGCPSELWWFSAFQRLASGWKEFKSLPLSPQMPDVTTQNQIPKCHADC